jgi:hypothetical protein
VTTTLYWRSMAYDVYIRLAISLLAHKKSMIYLEVTYQSLIEAYWLSFEFAAKAPPPRRIERNIV